MAASCSLLRPPFPFLASGKREASLLFLQKGNARVNDICREAVCSYLSAGEKDLLRRKREAGGRESGRVREVRMAMAAAAAVEGERTETNMQGKTVIVTGANTGMGLIIARELALQGAKVILASRSESKGKAAEEKVWREVKAQGGPGEAEFAQLDLSSLSSVREFVEKFTERHGRLDCLINNAGIMVPPHSFTPDGFESQFQVNHLSHYLLTRLLLPTLEASSSPKIIHISSLASENVNIPKGEFEKIARCKPEDYNAFQAYRHSKLAQVLFTVEMNRRLGGKVTVNSVHPGIVNTELFKRSDNPFMNVLIGSLGWVMETTGAVYSPEKGASTAIYLATASPEKSSSGGYFADCAPRPANPVAFDAELGREWWEKSAAAVGLDP